MNILLLSTYDGRNGSGRAAYRLHQGLEKIGVNSQMLVQEKLNNNQKIIGPSNNLKSSLSKARVSLDSFPLKFYSQRSVNSFSLQWLPDTVFSKVAQICPDIINLHWINEGYIRIETLAKLRKPLVWSLHDMWSFTGGCHYNGKCDRYLNSCGKCPQLGSNSDGDLSRWTWQRKQVSWGKLDLTIVALSSWLAECAAASSLLKNSDIRLIPNGIDVETYRPIDKEIARRLLRLPQDKNLILFGAMNVSSDKRKGFHLLQPALHRLCQAGWGENTELVVFGSLQPNETLDLGFKTHCLGTLSDDLSLALAYSASDIFIAPSTQENLANTVMESLACGTPCVAFNIGGMPDMIEHERNGYLASPYAIDDLVEGIIWILQDKERYLKLSSRAHEKVKKEFTMELQAQRYVSLFSEVLNRSL